MWKEKKANDKKKRKVEEEDSTLTTTYNDYTYTIPQQSTYCQPKLICVNCGKKLSLIDVCCGDNEEYSTNTLDIQNGKENGTTNLEYGMIFLVEEECTTLCASTQFSSATEIVITKIKETSPEEIRTIKNNPPEPIELDWDPELVINLLDPEQFHKHYQELTSTREEQKQCLEEINTQLCDHCLIPCNFQYCNECDLIYNLPPHIIYMIPEEEEPINSYTLESKSTFNPNSNSDNDNNKNNDSSFTQYGNKDNNNLDSNSNPKTYIALPDFTKEQKLK
ncbi:hypothetical protein G9A89_017526 [Geosiphon pyriformis]|nr:hypothetical protein G9A89_017526 [Geosiphon pyriformis]